MRPPSTSPTTSTGARWCSPATVTCATATTYAADPARTIPRAPSGCTTRRRGSAGLRTTRTQAAGARRSRPVDQRRASARDGPDRDVCAGAGIGRKRGWRRRGRGGDRAAHVSAYGAHEQRQRYMNWQTRIMYATYKKHAAAPGSILEAFTRILHRGKDDELMMEVPTMRFDPIRQSAIPGATIRWRIVRSPSRSGAAPRTARDAVTS